MFSNENPPVQSTEGKASPSSFKGELKALE